MLTRIIVVGATLLVLMAVARDQHWAQKAGVTGKCVAAAAPATRPTGYWYVCKQGILTGFPSLDGGPCSNAGVAAKQEVWVCTSPLVSLPTY